MRRADVNNPNPDEHRAALPATKRGDQPWPEVNAWRPRLHNEFGETLPQQTAGAT